jgi:hypothetical protein
VPTDALLDAALRSADTDTDTDTDARIFVFGGRR